MDHGVMTRALRQKRDGKVNSLGDLWGDWILGEAADLLDEQAARIAELEAEGKVWREAHDVQKKHHWRAVERIAELQELAEAHNAALIRAEKAEAERDEAIRALSEEGRLRGAAEARADAAWCAGRNAASAAAINAIDDTDVLTPEHEILGDRVAEAILALTPPGAALGDAP